ncbi:MAG: hypothetical protein AAF645_01725 [Myxococcota bacterium]
MRARTLRFAFNLLNPTRASRWRVLVLLSVGALCGCSSSSQPNDGLDMMTTIDMGQGDVCADSDECSTCACDSCVGFRSGCPFSVDVGGPCCVDANFFPNNGPVPNCEYATEGGPLFVACEAGRWVDVTPDLSCVYANPASPGFECPADVGPVGDPCCVDGFDGDAPIGCPTASGELFCSGGIWTLGPVCPDVAPPPEGVTICRDAGDCDGLDCVRDIPPGPLCGAVSAPERECEPGGCAAGSVCEEFESDEPCVDGLNSRCVARCTEDSCESDEVCGDEGRCEPRSCADGFVCPDGELCGVGGADLIDEHGCRRPRCGSEGGACAEGFRCDEEAALPGFFGCVPISCDEGFDCGPNRRCDPSDPAADSLRGCVPLECRFDFDCDCGACVFGRCEDRAFVCFSPPPSPGG